MGRRLRSLCAMALFSSAIPARAEMAPADRYVVTPDELKKTFTSKHPGPDWLVAHDDVFKFSARQKGELGAIESRLDGQTKDDARGVRAAYATYMAAAAAQPADPRAIERDIEALSKAQVAATQTIVDAHLAAFAVLDGRQRKQFEDLVRCCAPPP